jgi:hypothetical protein
MTLEELTVAVYQLQDRAHNATSRGIDHSGEIRKIWDRIKAIEKALKKAGAPLR